MKLSVITFDRPVPCPHTGRLTSRFNHEHGFDIDVELASGLVRLTYGNVTNLHYTAWSGGKPLPDTSLEDALKHRDAVLNALPVCEEAEARVSALMEARRQPTKSRPIKVKNEPQDTRPEAAPTSKPATSRKATKRKAQKKPTKSRS